MLVDRHMEHHLDAHHAGAGVRGLVFLRGHLGHLHVLSVEELEQMDQEIGLLRGKYLVDVISYNRVRGLPFQAAELASAIEEVIANA